MKWKTINNIIIPIISLPIMMIIMIHQEYYIQPITDMKESDNFVVVFIDTWNDKPWYGVPDWELWWENEVIPHCKNVLVPLRQYLVNNNANVVFSPAGFKIYKGFNPINEPVLNETVELIDYLRIHEIKTVYYVGYATNVCVLNRPTGIKEMSRLGCHTYLVEDATVALEGVGYTYNEAIALAEEVGTVVDIEYLKEKVKELNN